MIACKERIEVIEQIEEYEFEGIEEIYDNMTGDFYNMSDSSSKIIDNWFDRQNEIMNDTEPLPF